VSPKAIVVAGLSAIAIAASGCSGDSDPEAEFRAAFKKSFGEATWYHHITGMKMADGFLEITTDLDPKSDSVSRTICGTAMHFALDSNAEGIDGVQMRGSDGVPMGGCA
jgi:hypothetical protein